MPKMLPIWKETFLAIDVLQVIRDLHVWELTHPRNRKRERVPWITGRLSWHNDRARAAEPAGGARPFPLSVDAKRRAAVDVLEVRDFPETVPDALETARLMAAATQTDVTQCLGALIEAKGRKEPKAFTSKVVATGSAGAAALAEAKKLLEVPKTGEG